MSIFNYYASLRSEILEIVTGVENSGQSLFWDNTTPNYMTKRKLELLYQKYLREAESFGLYLVTRHCECPNPKHEDYVVSNDYGLTITYPDEDYIWSGIQKYQGKKTCACPCSPKSKISEHWVIEEIIYKKNSNQELCEKLGCIFHDIFEAIDCAGDNKPRSSIRENLLRSVLQINDQLLPEPMDIYIEKSIKKHA